MKSEKMLLPFFKYNFMVVIERVNFHENAIFNSVSFAKILEPLVMFRK